MPLCDKTAGVPKRATHADNLKAASVVCSMNDGLSRRGLPSKFLCDVLWNMKTSNLFSSLATGLVLKASATPLYQG